MTVPTRLSQPQTASIGVKTRRGFSFTEILFAVMILGIGFIMVAAIFPVAIHQTEASQGETVGAAVARAGVSFIGQMATTTFSTTTDPGPSPTSLSILQPTFFQYLDNYKLSQSCLKNNTPYAMPLSPASPELVGQVWSFYPTCYGPNLEQIGYLNTQKLTGTPLIGDILWPLMAQNMIQASDPRYAWVGFYRRNLVQTSTSPLIYSYASVAQVIVIALQSRAKQFYDQSDLLHSTTDMPISIEPAYGPATIQPPSATQLNYTIKFTGGLATALPQRAAEGAFVVIAADTLGIGTAGAGLMNGHVYRLGTQVDSITWEFAPGYSPVAGTTEAALISAASFQVYMVGKAQEPDPNNPGQYTGRYIGSAQDIAAYSTFIACPSN
jgi:hypothetical protein